jgi:hypothetical protein
MQKGLVFREMQMVAREPLVLLMASVAVLALTACRQSEKIEAPRATSDSPVSAPPTERVVGPLTPDDARALATMSERIKQYLDLHLEIEKSLPTLPKEASPQQIDQHQRGFEQRMREARAGAKQGDIFTPEARPVILRLLANVFGQADGAELKASIRDENPVDPAALKLHVNSRYPDSVPLTTIPPQVLQTLPALTEDLEYRFVGDWLILLDSHAHVIADYIDNALPR